MAQVYFNKETGEHQLTEKKTCNHCNIEIKEGYICIKTGIVWCNDCFNKNMLCEDSVEMLRHIQRVYHIIPTLTQNPREIKFIKFFSK